jgi:nucleoside-diphosphate-sugar epimerase
MKEINVIGTMQLLAACQKAPSMRKLVVKSTTAIYGSSPRDPALFTESEEPRALPKSGYAKDAVEVEGYVRGFGRRRPDVTLSLLRFTNFIGPTIESMLTRYFSLPVVPTVLGFDPRIQLCHEDDGIEALRRSTLEEHPGIFNVGGEGVLLLSQAIRRVGRPSFPVPAPGIPRLAQRELGRGPPRGRCVSCRPPLIGRRGCLPSAFSDCVTVAVAARDTHSRHSPPHIGAVAGCPALRTSTRSRRSWGGAPPSCTSCRCMRLADPGQG